MPTPDEIAAFSNELREDIAEVGGLIPQSQTSSTPPWAFTFLNDNAEAFMAGLLNGDDPTVLGMRLREGVEAIGILLDPTPQFQNLRALVLNFLLALEVEAAVPKSSFGSVGVFVPKPD